MSCLSYLTPEAARHTVRRFEQALAPSGCLIVSPAEASTDLYEPLALHWSDGVFRYTREPGQVVHAGPTLHAHAPPPPMTPPPVSPPPTADVAVLPDIPLSHARTLADQGRLAEAKALCERILCQDPLQLEGHLLLASICQEAGDLSSAIAALRRAVYIDPNAAAAHFAMGILMQHNGEARRGGRCMETVVKLLREVAPEAVVLGSDGLTAGRMAEMARSWISGGERCHD